MTPMNLELWRSGTPSRLKTCLNVLTWSLVISTTATAGNLTIDVYDIRNADGRLLIAICESAHFLKPDCPYRRSLPAAAGNLSTTFADVSPGRYAVQLFHDENANDKLDMDNLGIPIEGIGFSNDAQGNFGPPSFESAAFEMGAGDKTLRIRITY